MIDQLLSVETTRTIIQTIVNLSQPGAITDEISFILTKRFYQVLADNLDLQYKNILLASSTSAQIQSVNWNKGPFFTSDTDLDKKSLQNAQFDFIQDFYQSLGKLNCFLFHF